MKIALIWWRSSNVIQNTLRKLDVGVGPDFEVVDDGAWHTMLSIVRADGTGTDFSYLHVAQRSGHRAGSWR